MVSEIIEHSIFDESHHGVLLLLVSRERDQVLGNFKVRLLVGTANIVDHADLSSEKDDLEGAGNVLNKQEVSLVLSIAVKGHSAATHKLVDELGDQFLRELVRAVDVVATSDDEGHAKRSVVRLGKELGASLGGGVGVGGLQHLFLHHGILVMVLLAVHLIGGDVNESLDAVVLRGLKEHMRAHDVVLGELEGVAEGVVDVRLGREVHDRVDLFGL